MRISFDVDDTIVCDCRVPTEQHLSWWARCFFAEPLRRGTRELFRTLLAEKHELWIYTTSYRSRFYLQTWFRCLGIRISDVVNQSGHEQMLAQHHFPHHSPSKFPAAFGIDLHIDDSPGVAEEGREFGFCVLVVDPLDEGWAEQVLRRVRGYG